MGNYSVLPTSLSLENIRAVVTSDTFVRYLSNSVVVASCNAVLSTTVAIGAAYALSRFRLAGRDNIFFWLLTNRMAPVAAFLLPVYLLFTRVFAYGDWSLLDTKLGLILLYTVFNVPFAVWMLQGMIDAIPEELDEAAFVDGAGSMRVLWSVLLPILRPGLAVTLMFTWIFAWNEYLFASRLTNVNARTIPTAPRRVRRGHRHQLGRAGRARARDDAARRRAGGVPPAPHHRRPHGGSGEMTQTERASRLPPVRDERLRPRVHLGRHRHRRVLALLAVPRAARPALGAGRRVVGVARRRRQEGMTDMTTAPLDALVLDADLTLRVEPFPVDEELSPTDVRIEPHVVGVCGSDLHYVDHGSIGPFVVREPMVLGHEAAGVVIETGTDVTGLAVGDRVCMEPGIPSGWSKATLLGLYNLDPAVRFWATPPVHGVIRPTCRPPGRVHLQTARQRVPRRGGDRRATRRRPCTRSTRQR